MLRGLDVSVYFIVAEKGINLIPFEENLKQIES